MSGTRGASFEGASLARGGAGSDSSHVLYALKFGILSCIPLLQSPPNAALFVVHNH